MATKNDTSMTIRMNSDIKRQAQLLFDELGLDMSTAINIFLRQSVRESRIPFEIGAYSPNATTLEALREVEQMKADPHRGKTYTNVDQMMEELLANV